MSCGPSPVEGTHGRRVQCSESWGWDCYHHSGAEKTGIIITLKRIRLKHSFRLGFRASNNETKYEALLAGLRAIMDMGAREVEIYSDSQLLVSQVQGSFEDRDPRMKKYLQMVRQVMSRFPKVKVV